MARIGPQRHGRGKWTLKAQDCSRLRSDAACVVHGYRDFAGILCVHVKVSIEHILEPEWRTGDYPQSFIKFTMIYIIFNKSVLLNLLNVTRNNKADTSGEITFGNSDVL